MNGILSTSFSSSMNAFVDNVKDIIKNFDWRDGIDILILAVLLYFICSFFRGKKAGTLLVGILICVVLYAVSVYLRLSAVRFVLSGAFNIAPYAIIIIFQPEIRDALEKLGSGSLSSILSFSDQKKSQQEYYNAVDNICSAVADLSRTKTGALIVISRTTLLDDVVNTGVLINADTNAFLLRNLFFNKAPLHDGAVIIDNARIAAAGCLLPLTRRQDVDGDLGTRHRAAMGMSEISDAISIVVSEETGIISVAADCTLTRNYTQDSLKHYLLREWIRDKSDRNKK